MDIGTNIECDHKDGKYDDSNVSKLNSQLISNFQPLSKGVNLAKRQYCKVCATTGVRFDAIKLGYSSSYIMGDSITKSCNGCHWFGPKT